MVAAYQLTFLALNFLLFFSKATMKYVACTVSGYFSYSSKWWLNHSRKVTTMLYVYVKEMTWWMTLTRSFKSQIDLSAWVLTFKIKVNHRIYEHWCAVLDIRRCGHGHTITQLSLFRKKKYDLGCVVAQAFSHYRSKDKI